MDRRHYTAAEERRSTALPEPGVVHRCKEWWNFLVCENSDDVAALRASTYAGRPFGDEAFMEEVGAQFGRQWKRGRPRKHGRQKTGITIAAKQQVQFSLF
jgi:hypothetical protein